MTNTNQDWAKVAGQLFHDQHDLEKQLYLTKLRCEELLTALRNITVLAQNMRDALETGAPVEDIPNAYFNAAYNAIEKAEST